MVASGRQWCQWSLVVASGRSGRRQAQVGRSMMDRRGDPEEEGEDRRSVRGGPGQEVKEGIPRIRSMGNIIFIHLISRF